MRAAFRALFAPLPLGAIVVSSTLAACASDAPSRTHSGGDPPGAGGSGGEDVASVGAGAQAGCEAACLDNEICSVQGVCIDEGRCLEEEDCGPGLSCSTVGDDGVGTCLPSGDCGAQEILLEATAPNVLLVLDRSCSMDKPAIDPGSTKWQIATEAISALIAAHAGKIRFGLSLFPDLESEECTQETIAIPPAPDHELTIQALLADATDPSDPYFPKGPCVTNVDTAMLQAKAVPELYDPARKSFAVLITDGGQSQGCMLGGGDAGTEQALGEMLANGIATFVVGFGGGVDPMQLELFAEAGGVQNTGPGFYDASDQASLAAALSTIAQKTLGCHYVLETVPPDPSQIYVFFDAVPMASGWSYDPKSNTITFEGTACDSLESGSVSDVDVVFGCPEPTPD